MSAFLGNAVGTHSLPPYTIGLFIAPLQHEFGWTRASISLGVTLLTLCSALSAPIVGAILPRVGVGLLVVAGLLFGSASYFALSAMGSSVVVFWLLMACLSVLGSGCGPVTLSFLPVTTFEIRRGTALGIAMTGIGLSAAIAPRLLGYVVVQVGWRAGYIALGCLMCAVAPIMFYLLRIAEKRFPALGPAPAPNPVDVPWDDPVFLRLGGAFLGVALASGGVVVHYIPMLIDAGYETTSAAARASLVGVSLIAGRLITGLMIDRLFAPAVACVIMLCSALGYITLFSLGSEWISLSAILVGATLGAELDLIAYLVSRYFPGERFGKLVGVLFSTFLVGVAISPFVFGVCRDVFGTYAPCLLWSAASLGVSSVLFRGLPPFASDEPDCGPFHQSPGRAASYQ